MTPTVPTNSELDNALAKIAKLEAEKNAVSNNPLGKKRSVPEQVELLIKQTLKTKVWSKNKFASCDEDAGHLATKILKASKQTKFVDSEGNLNEDGQAWIEKHSGACVKALNDLRNEVTSGMQAEWKNYYTEHGNLPSIEQFTDVVCSHLNNAVHLVHFMSKKARCYAEIRENLQ